jgi:hypothetical protein
VGATVSNRNLEWVEKYGWPEGKQMIAGVVDGRSVWADLEGEGLTEGKQLIAGVVDGRSVWADLEGEGLTA